MPMGFEVWQPVHDVAAPPGPETEAPPRPQQWLRLQGGARGRHRRPRRTIVQVVRGMPPFPRRILKYPGPGRPLMHGMDVELWQRQARRKGYLLKPDGWYGPRSRKVAVSLQKRAGLVADGVVDPRTWAATWR
ncbi:peptidoglycan-binding protein [Actinomadura sp. GC306]|uniref:peptidoglycan-binding domain-containing protein n=1 Tax=Actinomadura sp. GC306 TaxID=2530367 RepID=UPI00104D82D7|nr:peptidoglycan-binding protein [Actinomadura sp. GC306]TDC61845.1 peptidoglycan-binding protein [Actinomadura sp. GC306]